jgi:hypothetical protein
MLLRNEACNAAIAVNGPPCLSPFTVCTIGESPRSLIGLFFVLLAVLVDVAGKSPVRVTASVNFCGRRIAAKTLGWVAQP